MTDTTVQTETVPATPVVKPGLQTSEGKLAAISAGLGVLAAIVPPLWLMLSNLAESLPQVRWIAAAVTAVGILSTVLVSLGYTNARTALKKAALGVLLLGFVGAGAACKTVGGVVLSSGDFDVGHGAKCSVNVLAIVSDGGSPPKCTKEVDTKCTAMNGISSTTSTVLPVTCP